MEPHHALTAAPMAWSRCAVTTDAIDPFVPLPLEECSRRADELVQQMTTEEIVSFVGGDRGFFIRPIERLGVREVYMTDATQGIHIRENYAGTDLACYQPERSTAFPCPLALAATWDPTLARRYARAVGTECRAAGIGILLGPGMNVYRQAQCGRNFEYMGEDPFLAARMVESYVEGLQSTGTMATLKHFVCNETDWFRRRSNSIVDERALHEIFLPAFEAGVAAGARAVMTAYNQLNGQWCGEDDRTINGLLRGVLGFSWMVMSDWWSVYDGTKLARSGQDLEMPHAVALADAGHLMAAGHVRLDDLRRMCGHVIAACHSMGLDRARPPVTVDFAHHMNVALETARQSIVLLKNDRGVLPLGRGPGTVLLTGPFVDAIAAGGGSARVAGWDNVTMRAALEARLGDRLTVVADPTAEQLRAADVVLCNVGTVDSEGWDRPFDLPADQEARVRSCVQHNPRTVVIVTSGSGVRMTGFADGAAAILYAWYGGQIGNVALAEILVGTISPSGKLPITIEKDFRDSPGYGYLPADEELYVGFRDEEEKRRPVWHLPYREGVFVGYRHFDHHGIEPLFPFGHGLTYTSFRYDELELLDRGSDVQVSFTVSNVGGRAGAEIAQVYVEDAQPRLPRPPRELKGFTRVALQPAAHQRVSLELDRRAFSYWDPSAGGWALDPGAFRIRVGASSRDLRLSGEITVR